MEREAHLISVSEVKNSMGFDSGAYESTSLSLVSNLDVVPSFWSTYSEADTRVTAPASS